MKKLSIIIVNYNVCYFLEQALLSVEKACKGLSAEIYVVDNNSVDGSVEMVKSKFPDVLLIENKENVGFSRANNQAIRQAKGEYILLLNPDTVVEEESLIRCCRFMDEHPDGGGLGVKMVDGNGVFLPESKRGLPTPWVAFYKIFGLAALFPKSRRFGRYHLGYLSSEEIHEVEVLSGAFMLLRKEAINKTGLLDEEYFMYGEDIDLSYRILKAGYKNYYFPEARIIHYKGESTKRTSINYVFVFYKAMIIFAKKHFSGQNANWFSFLINIAIYLRAGVSLISRYAKKIRQPLIDALLVCAGMFLLKEIWETNYKPEPGSYPPEFMQIAVPGYIIIWLLCVYFWGGYDKPVKASKIVKGVLVGTIIISAASNFLDDLRFSKSLIVLGGIYACTVLLAIRLVRHWILYKNLALGSQKPKRVAIIGNTAESQRVVRLLYNMGMKLEVVGYISPQQEQEKADNFLGHLEQMDEVVKIHRVNEIIFCSKDISANQIIHQMIAINNKSIEYKILPDKSDFIIGSHSSISQGELYTVRIDMAICQENNIRNKRMLDIGLSLALLVLFPFLVALMNSPKVFIKNIFRVLRGQNSWVGYTNVRRVDLPKIRKGILSTSSGARQAYENEYIDDLLDMQYARDYSVFMDINIIYKSFRKLGRA